LETLAVDFWMISERVIGRVFVGVEQTLKLVSVIEAFSKANHRSGSVATSSAMS